MKYITNKSLISSLAAVLTFSVTSSQADEYTVKLGELKQSLTLDAIAIPSSVHGISIKPKSWKTYVIDKFLPHGSSVKKGDKLLWLSTKSIDEKIEEVTKERVKQKLVLERAELEFKAARNTVLESLAKAKLDYQYFLEDHDYYKKVSRPQQIAKTEHVLKRAKHSVAYAQEELNQLLKMYQADGLTEETEEIIVKRAKNTLENTKKGFNSIAISVEKAKNITIPRADAEWLVKGESKKKAWELVQKNIPLDLKIKELALAKLRVADAKSAEKLADLKADRALMEITAPEDGVLYFGEFKDGNWKKDAAKNVVGVGRTIPALTTFMTVVGSEAKMKFISLLSAKYKNFFSNGQQGSLRLKSNPWKSFLAKSELVSKLPDLENQLLVSFTPEVVMNEDVVVGSKAKVSVMMPVVKNRLLIPVKAVTIQPDGTYTVNLKMAEGDPTETIIELGRKAGDKIEVLKGLENEQVIITP